MSEILFLANPLKKAFSLQFINDTFINKPPKLEVGFCSTGLLLDLL
ncbi:MAG TPA: hypothetical protein VMR88_13145 [Candidatus Polarisedimenticolaceae bacterium]|nr:hypothetical protein [Candidatus Polarisedimenticolaceae bacterium]